MTFKWQLNKTTSDKNASSVRELVLEMDEGLRGNGLPIEGFEFIHSSKKMLDITRQIENDILRSQKPSSLYVGFQSIEKLDTEISRYEELINNNIEVKAFGIGKPRDEHKHSLSTWVEIPKSISLVENQWFLVSESPSPIAFVGWEVSEEIFAEGKLSDPGKMFEGFVSSDERVIKSLLQHLDSVYMTKSQQPMDADGLSSFIGRKVEKVMLVTHDKPEKNMPFEYTQMIKDTSEICEKLESEVILYDLSAASFFVEPGGHGDSAGQRWKGLLNRRDLELLGRNDLNKQMGVIDETNVNSKALLAEKHGFVSIHKAALDHNVDLVIVPEYYENPSLIDKIVGNQLSKLDDYEATSFVVYDVEGNFKPFN
tara:strand:- start:49 stop:1155 length:1107 start_codon:yes stop_codon:yes gene_type:complete